MFRSVARLLQSLAHKLVPPPPGPKKSASVPKSTPSTLSTKPSVFLTGASFVKFTSPVPYVKDPLLDVFPDHPLHRTSTASLTNLLLWHAELVSAWQACYSASITAQFATMQAQLTSDYLVGARKHYCFAHHCYDSLISGTPANPVEVSRSAGPSTRSKGKHRTASLEEGESSSDDAVVSCTLGDSGDEEEEIMDVS